MVYGRQAFYRFSIFIAFFSLGLKSSGQSGYFETFNEKNLLSSNYINNIYQDSFGYIWISTGFGLNCYDGYQINTLNLPSPEPNLAISPEVNQVLEDSHKNLWIATSSGLISYDLISHEYNWHLLDDSKNSFISVSVRHLILDRENNLFVLTPNACFRYQRSDNRFEKLVIPGLEKAGFTKMLKDNEHNLWFVNDHYLLKWNETTGKEKIYQHNPPADPNSLGPLSLNNLFTDSKGNIWVSLSSGIDKYLPLQDNFEHHTVVGGVLSIIEDRQGVFWMATWEDGLCKYNPQTKAFSKYRNNPNDPFSLLSNSLRCLNFDSDGNLWIGTNGNGVNIFKEDYWRFKQYQSILGNDNSLNSNVIRSFCEAENGVWIGTENGGLNYFDRKTGKYSHYLDLSDFPKKRSTLIVLAICEDLKGQLWLGTIGGLFRFNKAKAGYEYVQLPFGSELPPEIWCISRDDNGILWLGSNNGLIKFNPHNKQAERFISNPIDTKTLSNNSIPSILPVSNNVLWVGTKNGLNKFDCTTHEVKRYFNNLADTNSIADNSINHILLSSKGELWFATNNGLSKFNSKKDNFTNFRNENWPSRVLLGMLEDEKGNLWISSHHGIINFSPQGFIVKSYGIHDGLQSNQFLSGAFMRTGNGEMFFGGVNGFNSFKPSEIRINKNEPKVLITSIFINNQEAKIGVHGSPLKQSLQSTQKISLNFGQNTFNLNFLAINYIHTEKNQYAYKLEGFDNEWINCDTRKTAFYTNIPHGKYRFCVKAANNDGVWNEQGTSLEIVVLPPIWATWWARFLYVLIPIIMLYFLRKYSIIGIKVKNQLELERIEKEKVKEVYDMKMRFFMNISHEFRTPLTLIIDPIENVLRQLRDESVMKKTLALSHKNALRMLGLVNQLLEFRKIETGNVALRVSEQEIVGFTTEVIDSFCEKAGKHSIAIELRTSLQQIQVWFDKEKMEIVLFNLLSNALKFTPENGRITISLSVIQKECQSKQNKIKLLSKQNSKQKEFVRLEVEDTGRGIPTESLEHIFDRFYQVAAQYQDIEKGTGIGLSLTKDLVELHGGSIEATSIVNIGSRFIVFLPTGNEHFAMNEIHQEALNTNKGLIKKQLEMYDFNEMEADIDDSDENLSGRRYVILFVDDNADISTYFKINMDSIYQVHIGHNGQEGFELAQKYLPDLIITDVMMPVMDGIEMTRKIKNNEITRHIPVILLSARSASESQREALEEGATDYITKPFSMDILQLKIRSILADREIIQAKYRMNLLSPSVEITYASADEKFMKKLHELIEKNIGEPNFEVESIVDQIGMSRAQLYRKLNSLTGQSVKEFVRNVRLRTAAELLAKGDLRVVEVMTMVGINNRAYFIKCFKEQFGVNPSNYKASLK